MSDLNTITVIGRLTQNPVNINSNKGGVRFSIANNGFKQEDTTFFNCTWFGERALKSSSWLTKGKQVAISGRMVSQKYNDKLYWSILINDIMPTGSKSDSTEISDNHIGAELAFQGYDDEEIDKMIKSEFNSPDSNYDDHSDVPF